MRAYYPTSTDRSHDASTDARAPGKSSRAEVIYRRAAGDAAAGADASEKVDEASRGSGAPLPSGPRAQFEQSLGVDLGGVRVHTDAPSAQASSALQAQAYTTGQDIHFAADRYAPEDPFGVHLLAHEVAHTVQQQGGPSGTQTKLEVSEPGDALEHEADRAADAMVRGEPTTVSAAGFGAARQIQREPAPAPAPTPAPAPAPATPTVWPPDDIPKAQKELTRLGLYSGPIDQDLGGGTKRGMVEAFGDDTWETMSSTDVITKLKAAKPPSGKAGQHNLRYGEMFKDGVIDMTLALGFDEDGHAKKALENLKAALTANKFAENAAEAALLYKQAGRAIDAKSFGDFFVRKDALTYTPPAGAARQIHAVVRLVYSLDGSKGKEVADAYKDGMEQSDIGYYSGHGRYGSGPDFDRNYSFDLLATDGSLERRIPRYQDLETAMQLEGAAAGRSAWDQFQWRVKNNRVKVDFSNAGNVVLNDKNAHPGEFGANLMYWAINQSGGVGSPKVSGKDNELAKGAAAHPERKYRVVVFDGCRSQDYNTAVRATPGYDSKSTDIFGSTKSLDWGDEGKTLTKFLEEILAMQSAENIANEMDKQQNPKTVGPGAYHVYGAEDNPVIK